MLTEVDTYIVRSHYTHDTSDLLKQTFIHWRLKLLGTYLQFNVLHVASLIATL